MEIPSRVRFADECLQKSFEGLKNGISEEKELREWLEQAFANIEKNAFCGIQIPKKLIPKEYINDYSIENQQICVVNIVLEWMNHKEYERRFNY